jgi:hypothetical protein
MNKEGGNKMFVAWLITIGLFVICFYSTSTIINGINQKDQQDLAALEAKIKDLSLTDPERNKQVI